MWLDLGSGALFEESQDGVRLALGLMDTSLNVQGFSWFLVLGFWFLILGFGSANTHSG